jgi:hypothetical protein
MTENYPPIFSSKGEFQPYDDAILATLPPQRQQIYADLKTAAEETATAEGDLRAALDAVPFAAAEVEKWEKITAATRMSYHDLWKQTFGRPRHAS